MLNDWNANLLDIFRAVNKKPAVSYIVNRPGYKSANSVNNLTASNVSLFSQCSTVTNETGIYVSTSITNMKCLSNALSNKIFCLILGNFANNYSPQTLTNRLSSGRFLLKNGKLTQHENETNENTTLNVNYGSLGALVEKGH